MNKYSAQTIKTYLVVNISLRLSMFEIFWKILNKIDTIIVN